MQVCAQNAFLLSSLFDFSFFLHSLLVTKNQIMKVMMERIQKRRSLKTSCQVKNTWYEHECTSTCMHTHTVTSYICFSARPHMHHDSHMFFWTYCACSTRHHYLTHHQDKLTILLVQKKKYSFTKPVDINGQKSQNLSYGLDRQTPLHNMQSNTAVSMPPWNVKDWPSVHNLYFSPPFQTHTSVHFLVYHVRHKVSTYNSHFWWILNVSHTYARMCTHAYWTLARILDAVFRFCWHTIYFTLHW